MIKEFIIVPRGIRNTKWIPSGLVDISKAHDEYEIRIYTDDKNELNQITDLIRRITNDTK